MPIALHLVVSGTTYQKAERREYLHQQADWVALGVRLDGLDYFTGDAVIGAAVHRMRSFWACRIVRWGCAVTQPVTPAR
jgi:hypothetical protein